MLARVLLEHLAMRARSGLRKKAIPQWISPRFASRLVGHVNTSLVMRYQENKRVHEVLEYLRSHGVSTTAQNFHCFLRRVLYLMPPSEATRLKVDAALLHAIRVRLKMPTEPKGIRIVVGKPTGRYDSRKRRRRLQVGPKPERPAVPPPPQPARRSASAADGRPLPPAKPTSSDGVKSEEYVFRGDPEKPDTLSRQDWAQINEVARKKLLAISRHIWPNQKGTVFHLRTRVEYTKKDLMEQFGLSANEAESCFQTF